VLSIVSEGKTNNEVAAMLWLTEQTIKFHLSNVFRKLGVANRTEAAHWVHRQERPIAGMGNASAAARVRSPIGASAVDRQEARGGRTQPVASQRFPAGDRQ
jgi:hypothetical protein